ncbi:MAG: hypothetical protein AB7Y46_14225 [Armatimonadota bacterium]
MNNHDVAPPALAAAPRAMSLVARAGGALALALASHPRLLILDDPTMGLDAVVRREFIESIVGVQQEAGTTVFFSSHIIDDVERVADWIAIIHEGRLLVQEPLEALKSRVRRVVLPSRERRRRACRLTGCCRLSARAASLC